ncbi:GNAT family N-acetyltransferase [Paenibacillus profundus]|uniref:GNAT family N-acetyltransferase n=1 Tax=Paenibacillus profundus TaxID=1173085 RepID=A0ABS8YKZ9_9BACL|nr:MULTISPECIES: GNAT family protein [Paenibacillus]MCE5171128.1 GNAT family N-acetyltransferase [Paenibacillus profundus]MCM3340045.1 GNAT family N-acetyltransferase [Paenibacillus sp. MER TA 81-3]
MNERTNIFADLETDRCALRQVNAEDAAFILRHFGSEEVCQFLLDEERYTHIDHAHELIECYADPDSKGHNRWMILNKDTGERMGTCGFHGWDRRNLAAEIGYDLSPEYWGRGYMSEVLATMLAFGFERMGLNRIQAIVYPDNERSALLLQKFYFVREGVIRDKHLYLGQFYDHDCYSLLRREWTGSQQ